jgi:hypothetical protein
MHVESSNPVEEIKLLEIKTNQLKLDYEKYFLGTRPTEPAMLRAEVQKAFIKWQNTRISNTALRFKFNSLNGRYQAFKRRWDDTLRKIEAGTYERHVFKANLHDRERGLLGEDGKPPARRAGDPAKAQNELFETYRDALMATGQDTSKLTPAKMQAALRKQEEMVKQKFGCERVDFRVVVKDGKVKVKAAAG